MFWLVEQNEVDLDGNGRISFDEFVMMMRLGGMETDFEKEIKDAFNFFDLNGDGVVSWLNKYIIALFTVVESCTNCVNGSACRDGWARHFHAY